MTHDPNCPMNRPPHEAPRYGDICTCKPDPVVGDCQHVYAYWGAGCYRCDKCGNKELVYEIVDELRKELDEYTQLKACDVCGNLAEVTAADSDSVQCIPCTELAAAQAEIERLPALLKVVEAAKQLEHYIALIGHQKNCPIHEGDECDCYQQERKALKKTLIELEQTP